MITSRIFILSVLNIITWSKDTIASTMIKSNVDVSQLEVGISDSIKINSVFFWMGDRAFSDNRILELAESEAETLTPFNYRTHVLSLIKLENKSGHKQHVVLRESSHSSVRAYFIIRNGRIRHLDKLKFRFDAVDFELPPGETILGRTGFNSFGNIPASSALIGISLVDFKEFQESSYLEGIVCGTVYGIVVLLILYNVAMYFVFRKVYFLLYAGFSSSMAGIFATTSGFIGYELNTIFGLCISAAIFSMVFTNSALNIRKSSRVLFAALVLTYLSCFLIMFIGYFIKNPFILMSSGLFATFYMFAASIVRYRQGYSPAILYICGYLVFSIGFSLTVINNIFLKIPWLGWASLFGWVMEIAFFSFAIALKVRISEKSAIKKSMQAFSQLSKIVYPHQLSQIEKGEPLEETMPVGESEACVLSFDVVGSSQIKHEKFADAMEEFMSRTRLMMMDGYDAETMTSKGYMIKEMGDGFLCSVGFPFKSLGDLKTEDAVDLGQSIIETFTEVMQGVDAEHPIYCSIGIAKGPVKAYFSKSGSIRHDLWGKAIVLATRYEAMRKRIFETLNVPVSSVLLLQDEVYASLSSEKRAKFQTIELKKYGMKVRDDSGAERIALRIYGGERLPERLSAA